MNKLNNIKSSLLILTCSLIFLIFLTINPTRAFAQDYQKQSVLDINLHYKENQVTLTSVDRREGFLPDYLNQPETGYTLQILDKDAKELFKVKFNFPLEIITEDFSNPQQATGSVQTLSEVDHTVTVPAFENATTLVVFAPSGQKLLEHNLSLIADPKLAQRDATQPKVAVKTPNRLMITIGAIILGLILASGLAFLYIRHKKSQLPENPPNNL